MKRTITALALLAALAVVAAGCNASKTQKLAAKNYQSEQTEQQNALSRATKEVPVEFPSDFDDRRNINERNIRLNDPNKITYLYLVALDGTPVMHDTAKGPITPCSSAILPSEGPVRYRGADLVVPQPEPTGVFQGSEADCVFWFTPQGAYREWAGQYFMSDQPVTLSSPVRLVVNANAAITHSQHAKTGNDGHR